MNGSSLLSLILVGRSALGSTVISSYPSNPVAVPRSSKPVYAKPPSQSPTPSQSGSASSDSDSEQSDAEEEDYSTAIPTTPTTELHLSTFPSSSSLPSFSSLPLDSATRHSSGKFDTYLGLSHPVLAQLLSPSRPLCDQPFELVVDHLAFVGHPVHLSDDPSRRSRKRDGTLHSTTKQSTSSDEDEEDEEDYRGRQARRVSTPTSTPPPSSLPSSFPSSSNSNSYSTTSSALSAAASPLISLNFVCVIDTPPDSHLSSHLEAYYKDVVVPFTANLKALELTSGWVGKEAAKIRKAHEDHRHRRGGAHDELDDGSQLGSAIRSLYHAIKSASLCTLTLGPLSLQILLRDEIPIALSSSALSSPSSSPSPSSPSSSRPASPLPSLVTPLPPLSHPTKRLPFPLFSQQRTRPPPKFQPWETLLLLEDQEDLKEMVRSAREDEGETEPGFLEKFLDICDPSLTFAEFEILILQDDSSPSSSRSPSRSPSPPSAHNKHDPHHPQHRPRHKHNHEHGGDLDKSGGRLHAAVAHLVHWKKAKVIDVVSLKNPYAVARDFAPAKVASLSLQFRSQFPSLPDLPTFLSLLPTARPIQTLIPSNSSGTQKHVLSSAIIWLLQEQVIEKLRTFIRVVISPEIKKAVRERWKKTRSTTTGSEITSEDNGSSSGIGDSASAHAISPAEHTVKSGSSAAGGGGERTRARTSSARLDFNDTRSMAIVGMGIGSSSGEVLSRSAGSMSQSLRVRSMLAAGATMSAGGSSGGGKRDRGFSTTASSNGINKMNDGEDEDDMDRSTVLLEPGRPTARESRWLSEICTGKEREVVARFERMLRMLNGQHDLDEIRFRSGLARRQVRLLLSAFKEHLILFTVP